jgi:AraC family transcriptional activator of pobA
VALTIHPSLAHGFAFSEEAYGYVLTIDQNMLFAAAGQDGNLFTAAVRRAARDRPGRGCRRRAAASRRCCSNLLAEAWAAAPGPHPDARLAGALHPADAGAGAGGTAHRRKSGRNDFELFSRFRVEVEEHYKEQWRVGQYADKLRVTPCA